MEFEQSNACTAHERKRAMRCILQKNQLKPRHKQEGIAATPINIPNTGLFTRLMELIIQGL